jgi:hypothetical protein
MMLVAYGPDGRVVTAGETPVEQLRRWSQERLLYCPNCRGVVHVRGGPEKHAQLHFAHQRGECAWSNEAESVRHMRGKLALAAWLREQFPRAEVSLEKRLPEPNRIADIFVSHPDGACQAVEFQCAPLDLEEWRHRHAAYRSAGIIDTWVIGENRRAKQEAFIEAILIDAREALFLDPLLSPPRAWLRWPVSREMEQAWQHETRLQPLFEGWVGRMGNGSGGTNGATLVGYLQALRLDRQGRWQHPTRDVLDTRHRLLTSMSAEHRPDEATLRAYLQNVVDEQTMHDVMLPLLRAYMRDPDLLRRYNYGRGRDGHVPALADGQRVQRARAWLEQLANQGYDAERLCELATEIPLVGSYAALRAYLEVLVSLTSA